MVTYEEIISKTLTVRFKKTDLEGVVVKGNATYNKDNRLTDANGETLDLENVHIASFSLHGSGENAKTNLTDCQPGMMGRASEVAEATLADLASGNPEK
jgi:hypothetical protein